jgi:hypothetical protein
LLPVLNTVFAGAATPQKCVFVLLGVTMLAAPLLAIMARSDPGRAWGRALADLRLAGPLLGLLMAGMNSFHMARTILKLPGILTVKQIAPGILEVSTLVVMGVLAGLIAQACRVAVDILPMRAR